MNLLQAIQARGAVKDKASRAWPIAERCYTALEAALGPAMMRAFRSDGCKDVRDRYVAATTAYARAMVEFDGTPQAVVAVSETGTEYLRARVAVIDLAGEMALARGS